jgi:hypothetical protein
LQARDMIFERAKILGLGLEDDFKFTLDRSPILSIRRWNCRRSKKNGQAYAESEAKGLISMKSAVKMGGGGVPL